MSTRFWHYFVGDIHGCFDTLLALEDRIHAHAAAHGVSPRIISVGDLIDRGPRSDEVVRHFGAGMAAGTHAAVLGNHDTLFLACLREFGPWAAMTAGMRVPWPSFLRTIQDDIDRREGGAKYLLPDDLRTYRKANWISQGGYQTLASFGCDPHRPATWTVPPDALEIVLRLPLLWQNEDFVVTHALASAQDLEAARGARLDCAGEPAALSDDERRSLQATAHALTWQRKVPADPPDPRRTHVSGHTEFRRPKRFPKRRIIQIDTGCVYGRRLTAWCGERDECLSEPLRDAVR